MDIKTEAICLHQLKYSDNSVIVSCYTREKGRLSFLIHGAHSKRAKIKASLFQPLQCLNLNISYKENRELQRLKDVSISEQYHNLTSDLVKSSVAIFLAELIHKILKIEQENASIYTFIKNSLSLFNTIDEHIHVFHLVFLVEFAKYIGFQLQNNNFESTSVFNLKQGHFIPGNQIDSYCLDNHNSKQLQLILKNGFKSLPLLKFSNAQRRVFIHSIVQYYRYHLDTQFEIYSLSVLKDLFQK